MCVAADDDDDDDDNNCMFSRCCCIKYGTQSCSLSSPPPPALLPQIFKHLRDYARTIAGKDQLIIASMAKSLEVIPRQLCDNAGFDSTNLLNKLRQKHAEAEDGKWFGIDVRSEDISDNYEACVWEPSVVKRNALTAATEAACLILSVDETIKAPKSQQEMSQAQQRIGM